MLIQIIWLLLFSLIILGMFYAVRMPGESYRGKFPLRIY